ncbi:uncharacterized protein LOC132758203 [Ruditapes philippinarum]|uniref:uncharacterized protein LOC132758203 n=1 Tax=Ruditapes philippinarum TaxID=129788 RepID=UPI00295AC34F|nr:uncharacterized protein LOC132758203 [Ruditapes philippinarum]
MKTAHYYQVSCLVEYCADFLCTILSPTNACGILTHALLYELASLRDICCSFIDNNVEVLKSDGFLDLSEAGLLYILKGDTLNTKEENIIEAAEKWSMKKLDERGIEQNGTNARKIMGQAFFQLRIPTLTNKSLVESISRKGYLSVEEYSDIAAFINKVDGIRVASNSCIKRVQDSESVTVQSEYGTEERYKDMSTSFKIYLKKDVVLRSIVFNTMKPYLTEWQTLYTEPDVTEKVSVPGPEYTIACHKYEDKILKISKVIKPSPFTRKAVHANYDFSDTPYRVSVLKMKPYKKNILPENMNLTLCGSVEIKALELKKEFEMQQQMQYQNNKVDLNPPLILKKKK